MGKFANKFKIKPSRLKNWNYSASGIYFITICTLNHNNFFGKIINNKMVFSDLGRISREQLLKTIIVRNKILIDPWVIMPNHIHLLINVGNFHVETHCNASLLQKNIQNSQIIGIKNDRPETHCNASLHKQSNQSDVLHSYKNHPEFYSDINNKSIQIIPQAIKAFKGSVRRISDQSNLFFAWQSRYHDMIIKNEKQFFAIKNYIINNPINWEKDKYYL